MKKFLALSLSDYVFILLIDIQMPTVVGILTFMIRINFKASVFPIELDYCNLACRKFIHITSSKRIIAYALIRLQECNGWFTPLLFESSKVWISVTSYLCAAQV